MAIKSEVIEKKESDVVNGRVEIEFSHWKGFVLYLNDEFLNYTEYVYRGQGDSTWLLTPTIDRVIKQPGSEVRYQHLDRFKKATLGRRGLNPQIFKNENDWWALGQHHGLATPLLDWTESPFVALYFAAISALDNKTEKMSVFALSTEAVTVYSKKIKEKEDIEKINNRKPTIKIVRPETDENGRLISQRGLFTRAPDNMDIEKWIQKFSQTDSEYDLMKISFPNFETENLIRFLHRMNISNATLFPDLAGASGYCNRHLEIESY